MQAIDALTQRVSCGKLSKPGPSEEQLEVLEKAALRAADHAGLKPWRFLLVSGEGLDALGALYVKAGEQQGELSDAQRDKYLKMPHRAPLVIVAIAEAKEHPKVPISEQLLATGAAVQALITAAYAQGLGAYWRTGALAYDEVVKKGLGVAQNESIVGFVYVGTPAVELKPTPLAERDKFFTVWPAN